MSLARMWSSGASHPAPAGVEVNHSLLSGRMSAQNRLAEERVSPSTVHGGNQIGQQMVESLRAGDNAGLILDHSQVGDKEIDRGRYCLETFGE